MLTTVALPRASLPAAFSFSKPIPRHSRVAVGAIFLLSGAMSIAPFSFYPRSSLAAPTRTLPTSTRHQADFGLVTPSREVRRLTEWVVDSRDNGDAEFIVVDKRNAKVYVFDAHARLRASSPILLGAAKGDDSVPGIGTRPLSQVRPEERTTPAGRFVAEPGRNLKGEDVVWVDYDAAVSMHRVRATNPVERRLQRLATPTIADNRISYGCINVPVAFYESFVSPTVATKRAIVYVLPEVKSLEQVFGLYDVNKRRQVSAKSR